VACRNNKKSPSAELGLKNKAMRKQRSYSKRRAPPTVRIYHLETIRACRKFHPPSVTTKTACRPTAMPRRGEAEEDWGRERWR
jgi:hypothetical protein